MDGLILVSEEWSPLITFSPGGLAGGRRVQFPIREVLLGGSEVLRTCLGCGKTNVPRGQQRSALRPPEARPGGVVLFTELSVLSHGGSEAWLRGFVLNFATLVHFDSYVISELYHHNLCYGMLVMSFQIPTQTHNTHSKS